MDTKKEQPTFEKYEKDGKVAVLYSPGYGAGWSTWNTGEYEEALLFDKDLVEFVLNDQIEEMKNYIENHPEKYGDPYLGGLRRIRVKWIPKGQQFEVELYEGSESIHLIGNRHYKTA